VIQDPVGQTDPALHNVVLGLPDALVRRLTNFDDPHQEWRRLFSEVLGTFFLVLVAAGGGMMASNSQDLWMGFF
jgi:hypothetical protein